MGFHSQEVKTPAQLHPHPSEKPQLLLWTHGGDKTTLFLFHKEISDKAMLDSAPGKPVLRVSALSRSHDDKLTRLSFLAGAARKLGLTLSAQQHILWFLR